MKKTIKILCIVIALLIIITLIIFGACSFYKHIRITNSTGSNKNELINSNDKYEINEDLLKLDSDEYYIEIGASKDVLFELRVSDNISNQTIELMGDNIVIGELNDKGVNGDNVAGDNIYSSVFSLQSDTPKSIEYYVIVDKYKSNSIDITYYKQLTKEDYQLTVSIDNNINEIESTYIKNSDGSINEASANDVHERLLNYFDSLKEHGIVIEYTEYFGTFTLELSNGLTYEYIFDLSDEDVLGKTNEEDVNVSFSVASLEPYANGLDGYAFDDSAKKISNSNFNYRTYDNINNENVNVEFMLHLNKYNVVIINTHGGFNGESSTFSLGVKGSEEEFYSYSYLLGKNGGLVQYKDGYYGVSKNFFKKQYEDNTFDNTIIYIGSCSGADDSIVIDNNRGLAETLLDKGANCVFAYKNTVYSGYDNKMCETIFSSMLETKDNKLTTAREALKIAKDKHGDKDPTYSKWYHYLLSHTMKEAWAPKAELILFEKDNDSDYTLLHNMGCVLGQCVDNEDEMCIFATNNVYRNSDDGTRELYCSNADTGISNINLVLPPDKYILEIIPKGSIYESKEIALDVKSNQVINLGNINIDKKVITTTKPVNSTTYVNEEYGWSVELPEEWNKYGFIVDNSVNPMLLTGADTVNFCHKEMYNSYGDGGIFSILACPLEDYHNISDSSFYKKITENAEYVYLYHEFEIQFDTPLSSEKYDILLNEYNILHKAKDSIIESFKLLN